TTPPSTPAPSGTWTAGKSYTAGDKVTYNGSSYECVQAHTATAGWEPANAAALWRTA
ncbi:carbohydrate-binding protein, partial [Actinomadura rubrisoli]